MRLYVVPDQTDAKQTDRQTDIRTNRETKEIYRKKLTNREDDYIYPDRQ